MSAAASIYRNRDLIERFFNRLKHFRGIATRYNKLARNFRRSTPSGQLDDA